MHSWFTLNKVRLIEVCEHGISLVWVQEQSRKGGGQSTALGSVCTLCVHAPGYKEDSSS